MDYHRDFDGISMVFYYLFRVSKFKVIYLQAQMELDGLLHHYMNCKLSVLSIYEVFRVIGSRTMTLKTKMQIGSFISPKIQQTR